MLSHTMFIQVETNAQEGAMKAEDLKTTFAASAGPQRLALKELPCPMQNRNCHAMISVPDELTIGEWIDRETADKAGQLVVLRLRHQEG